MPIQQIGPAAQNEFTSALYYAPPPQQPPNVFAAFWAGFLRERTPWAREVFSARLRALDPSAKAAALLDLEKEATKRTQAQLSAMNAARASDTSLLQTIINSNTQLANKQTDAAMKNAELSNERFLKRTTLTSDQQKKVFDVIGPSLSAIDAALRAGDSPDSRQALTEAINAINGELGQLTGQLDQGEREAVERLIKVKIRGAQPQQVADPIIGRLNVSSSDTAPPDIATAGGASSVISRSFGDAGAFGVNTSDLGGGSARYSQRGQVAPGGGDPGSGFSLGGSAAPAVPALGVTRADIERVFDPRQNGLGAIGDPIFSRENRGTARKREAIEAASPAADVAFRVGAEKAADMDRLDLFLGGGVGGQVRDTAKQFAGAEAENKVVGGAGAAQLRKPKDQAIADAIDVTPPAGPTRKEQRELKKAGKKAVRFDERAAQDIEGYLAGGQTPKEEARTKAFDAEFDKPVDERSLAAVRKGTKDEMRLAKEAEGVEFEQMTPDELAELQLDEFLKRKKKNGGVADAR
jgi:hypothetical protein